ncbi:SH3 domain-containing protein [Thermoleptolyngbya oregonensis NK1-22]|uniref:SH3 domain-containing protein n=1 Tax=Thermoleptolyngbya oregonensis NK1-22 TaxID=2547457 RepID=A0AA96Y779_9CYAN|nr:SH3 domain-containing protein [Thermoleptolyngbya oregonensis]WOB43984.1 SH3 domain-containing protein [Thermoleptolyngbya oregonensis NK1-22]
MIHMRVKHWIAGGLAACSALVIAATAALAQVATVTVNDLNVRSGPGTSFPVTFVLRRGDRVEIIRRQGNWAFVVGERGGEGWVFGQYLSTTAPSPAPSPTPTNDVFRGTGTIDNARYNGSGEAQLVIGRQNRNGSFSLTGGRFNVEYIGTVRSNFEGAVELQISQFRSSEMGYRTVSASGTCNIQTSGGTSVSRSFCSVTGSGIDHGRSNFTGR